MSITENVHKLLEEVPRTNKYGEPVSLVAAVKTQTPEAINEAIAAGITQIADNHVQEFRDKYDAIQGNPSRQFIGHLQTNKIKYLVGKVDLYHSVDRMELAQDLSARSVKAGVVSEILIQINAGNQETKGGFDAEEAEEAVKTIAVLPGLKIRGLMAMLPFTDDETILRPLARQMRSLFDTVKAYMPDFDYLSMGMSGDWKLCIEEGSNMVRIGTAIFGPRNTSA
ncbi:MAG: YggS family pyridoxal phosphate-dependent enzyme [Clostridia bacterium]|nr:YggS family pyridoxal phosphate-dependent enzyme [Clostridia bacterium]